MADDIKFPNEAIDESYLIDAAIGLAGGLTLEAVGRRIFTSAAEENGTAAIIPGYTATESQVINEARSILNSSQIAPLENAYQAGQFASVNIGGRLILYVPDAPASISGMSLFGENGFLLGPNAFSSVKNCNKLYCTSCINYIPVKRRKGFPENLRHRKRRLQRKIYFLE